MAAQVTNFQGNMHPDFEASGTESDDTEESTTSSITHGVIEVKADQQKNTQTQTSAQVSEGHSRLALGSIAEADSEERMAGLNIVLGVVEKDDGVEVSILPAGVHVESHSPKAVSEVDASHEPSRRRNEKGKLTGDVVGAVTAGCQATDATFGITYRPKKKVYNLPSEPAFVDEDEFEQQMMAEFRIVRSTKPSQGEPATSSASCFYESKREGSKIALSHDRLGEETSFSKDVTTPSIFRNQVTATKQWHVLNHSPRRQETCW